MKRDAFNYLGQKVAEVEMPDGTSEEVWTNILANYSAAPVAQKIVENRIEALEEIGSKLIRELKAENTLLGITIEQSAQMFSDYSDVLVALREGAFPTAIALAESKVASGFMTEERKQIWINKIKSCL